MDTFFFSDNVYSKTPLTKAPLTEDFEDIFVTYLKDILRTSLERLMFTF